MDEKVYVIRKLTRKDRKVLTSLIKKLASQMDMQRLTEIIQSNTNAVSKKDDKDSEQVRKETDAYYVQLAINVFDQLLQFLDDDMAKWFIDLLGITIEEYDDAPFGIEALVVEQIINSKEIADFFASASGTYKTIQKYRIVSQTGKME